MSAEAAHLADILWPQTRALRHGVTAASTSEAERHIFQRQLERLEARAARILDERRAAALDPA